jgi:hypothetical protein
MFVPRTLSSRAEFGVMTALPVWLEFGALRAAAVFAFLLNAVKVSIFARLRMV